MRLDSRKSAGPSKRGHQAAKHLPDPQYFTSVCNGFILQPWLFRIFRFWMLWRVSLSFLMSYVSYLMSHGLFLVSHGLFTVPQKGTHLPQPTMYPRPGMTPKSRWKFINFRAGLQGNKSHENWSQGHPKSWKIDPGIMRNPISTKVDFCNTFHAKCMSFQMKSPDIPNHKAVTRIVTSSPDYSNVFAFSIKMRI